MRKLKYEPDEGDRFVVTELYDDLPDDSPLMSVIYLERRGKRTEVSIAEYERLTGETWGSTSRQ